MFQGRCIGLSAGSAPSIACGPVWPPTLAPPCHVPASSPQVFCNKIDTCRLVENHLNRQAEKGGRAPLVGDPLAGGGSASGHPAAAWRGNSAVHPAHAMSLVTACCCCPQVLPFHEAIRDGLRDQALTRFLAPTSPSQPPLVLVCTDRTSRGIDCMFCEHVVLFDFPRDPSEYVRRVGRTARGAGGRGVVSVLVLGKQVGLAKEIIERNQKGQPVHRIPEVE